MFSTRLDSNGVRRGQVVHNETCSGGVLWAIHRYTFESGQIRKAFWVGAPFIVAFFLEALSNGVCFKVLQAVQDNKLQKVTRT